ncbi:putative disease resistance RPP13-like protein 1 [Arachis ipaensis]|uniref:putative disease resistance RPP13-like protein 1 n=1 Tax=Arachis ipaensis TaxID=130454 RepID=UPI0007AF2BFC|nr:putative disease resistance RPP13-like protein 1 [Arachis ipaensis]XP_025634809.1 putative disease resistance RPP13-like protein 1 [Arachis hypogaea]
MAAKLDGGAYLTSFVDAVLDKLSSILEDDSVLEGNYSAQELLGRLEKSLYDVGPVLDDAEQKQFTDKRVKKWLVDLQDALYFADDLLDELSTKAAIAATQGDPGNSSSCSRLVDSYIEDNGDMEKIVGKLESLVERKAKLGLEKSAKLDTSWRIPSTSLVVSSDIFGRDKEKRDIIKLLLDDSESPLTLIPIWGMGGIGKTALAQLVYSDAEVVGKFDTRAWVCVAENFNPISLTRTILEKITCSSYKRDDFDSLQTHLKQKLIGKTFLVVLDDVWHDQQDIWEDLLKPFRYGNHGSKILLTTRSEKVASVVATTDLHYQLSLLSNEDCWLVFSKHARLSADSMKNPTLQKVGKDIVKKCDGLPLAAQALGGLLRGNSEVKSWNHILKNEIWKSSNDKIKIVPALRVSYYYLPSCLKKCFVYCSIYPKSYEFDKDELILLWMAENLLQPVGEKSLEEVGDEYFDELFVRSFFQPHSTNEKTFVMHDLVHDLAMIYAGEFCFRAEEHENAVEIDIKARHLSHNAKGNYPISKLLGVCDRVEHTRTFLEINLSPNIPFDMENTPCILLSKLKRLRALSFKCFPLESLPDSIGELIHLRYLDLSGTYIVTLPESLGNLYNLQTLKLIGCEKLKMLPDGMQNLVNLRHLDIRATCLREMPKGMSKLKSLQFLSDFVVGKHEENKIKELGALANLRESISIDKLENVVDSSEAWEARMFDKDGIDSLKLSWWSHKSMEGVFAFAVKKKDAADSQIERDILDKLQPHSNLKEVEISGYRGTTFPDWLGNSSYHNITTLTLQHCNKCSVLPSFGQLPSLKHLTISDFKSLKTVGAEFYKGGSCLETPFPVLETLTFCSISDWVKWHSMEFNAFPRLAELTLSDCPMLRGDLPYHLPSLQSLTIDNSKDLCCCLPRAPAMASLNIVGGGEVSISELPLLLRKLSIHGMDQVEPVVKAFRNMQLTCLTSLCISDCSFHISFPVSSIPASLQELTISGCAKLELEMDGHHKSLQSLSIIYYYDSATSFSWDAFPNLVRLNIRKCKEMESIVVSRSLSCLRSLHISCCQSLKSVSTLWMAAPQLEDLKIVDCPEIELCPTGDGHPHRSLRSLTISYSKLISCAAFMNLQFYGLTHLRIFGNKESVKCLPKEGWLPASLESLRLFKIHSVETLECKGLAHLNCLQQLSIYHCSKLKNIEGEKLPASLKQLIIKGTPLLGKRCKKKDPEVWPKISHIHGIQVDNRWIL